MASKVSALIEATSIAATDLFYAVVGGASRKIKAENVWASLTGSKHLFSYASLNAAVTAIGASQATLWITSSTTVASSVTVPSNITLVYTGTGQISVNASQTVTINSGNPGWPVRQLFAGTGSVAFGTNIKIAYPEWFGAVGDGSTDDSTAIDKTQVALSAGAALCLGPKTYLVSSGLTPKKSILWKGAGRLATILKRSSGGHIFVDSGSFILDSLAFEDIGFDAGNSGWFVFNMTGFIRELRLTRCRLWKFGTAGGAGYGISAAAVTRLTVEQTLFHNPGNAAGVGIVTTGGTANVSIRNCDFRYCSSAYVADDTTGRTEHILFEGNYVDGAWPYLVATVSDSGADVSYSATVLTDSDAAFGSLTAGNQVRVLPVRVNGTGAGITYTRTTLVDTDAPFSAVREGDIVRSGTKFAIVSRKVSNSVLNLEEWLSDTDRLPVDAPANNTDYTLYQLILGDIVSNTGTTVTVNRWFDIDGTSVTPAAQTLYEVLSPRSQHAVNISDTAGDVKIRGNTIKRSGADQIIATGSEQIIEGNHISYGWDMGITLWGSKNIVRANIIKHQGVGGIWTNGNDNLIQANQISDSRWINNTTSPTGGDIEVQAGNRNRIENNFCNRLTTVNAHYGILISANGGACADNVISNNTSINHVTDDVTLFSFDTAASGTEINNNTAGVISQLSQCGTGVVTATRLSDNKATTFNMSTGFFVGTYSNARLRDNEFGTIAVAGGTTITGTDFGVQRGSGSPDGAVLGSVGNIYMRSNGGAGTSVYFKESGNDTNTGWVAK